MEDWKKENEERQAKYGKECQAELKADKNFPLNVSPEQAVLILEPNHAPENFYQDGEISEFEAMENWLNKLKMAGLNPYYRTIIKEYIFG
jgi:hypothetical protein